MTSYGPVTSSAVVTPGSSAISAATAAALPTSVWMRMYAWTTACPSSRLRRWEYNEYGEPTGDDRVKSEGDRGGGGFRRGFRRRAAGRRARRVRLDPQG